MDVSLTLSSRLLKVEESVFFDHVEYLSCVVQVLCQRFHSLRVSGDTASNQGITAMNDQKSRELIVFPLGENDWKAKLTWRGPLNASDLKRRKHVLYRSALSVPHIAMPRVLALPELKILCKDVCLPCSLFSCSKHVKRKELKISNDGSQVQLDVSNRNFLQSISEDARSAIRDSLYEEVVYRDREGGAIQVRLRSGVLDPNLCLFCTRSLHCVELHRNCPTLSVERSANSRADVTFLTFKSMEDLSRWRDLAKHRQSKHETVPGGAAELAIRYITPLPQWLVPNICWCCGVSGSASPSSISMDRKTLTFSDIDLLNKWKASHDTPKDARWSKTKHGAIRLLLKSPMHWRGEARRCQCCARLPPPGYHPVPPPIQKFLLAGSSAELHFQDEDHAEAWMRVHPEVRQLPNAPLEWRWCFGIAQLLPLLRTLSDFGDYAFVEHSLFSSRHVARCIGSCSALEASYVARQAHLMECASLKLEGKHRIYLRAMFRKSLRVRVTSCEGDALRCDHLGRIASGQVVRSNDLLVRYKIGDKIEETRVRQRGVFIVTWITHSADFIDVAELSQLSEEEGSGVTALELHDAQTRKAKDALQRQSQFMHLLKEATIGTSGALDSSLQLVKRLDTGKKMFRADEGTTRTQAETGAHVFHAGAIGPLVSISETVASGLSVLRVYENSREDHLALFRRRTYPGAWKVLHKGTNGRSRHLAQVPDSLFQPGNCSTEMQYAQSLCTNEIIGSSAAIHCTQLLRDCCESSELQDLQHRSVDEIFAELINSQVPPPLKELQEIAEQKCEFALAARIEKARADADFCWQEVIVHRLANWCRDKGVTHLVAHPIDMDRYYVVRNPVDNSGSVQCVTLKVVPGLNCGANFSALLLLRFGMDYDGDHAVFIAVMDLLSVQIQESLFGPDNKLFSEGGDLVIAPTFWPLERWCSLLEGTHVRIAETDALRILSGAGRFSSLVPAESIRKTATHAVGTRLNWAPSATFATVFALHGLNASKFISVTVASFHTPWLLRTPDGRQFTVDAEDFTTIAADHVAWKADPHRRNAGALVAQVHSSEIPETWLRVVSRDTRSVFYCSSIEVWRADISGCDLLGCLLACSLRPNVPVHIGSEKRQIWNGGKQVFGGRCCSFQVPACAARGWECLTLKAVLLGRKALHRWRRGLHRGWERFALKITLLSRKGLRSWRRGLLADHLKEWPAKPWMREAFSSRVLCWAAMVLRMLYAQRSARAPVAQDLLDIVVCVAIHESPRVALEIATNIQTTAYLICPTLQARSHPQCTAPQQKAVELCVDLLNFVWDAQPPIEFPRYAEASAQLRRRGLAEPCKRIFEKLVAGPSVQRSCGLCEDCASQVALELRRETSEPSSVLAKSYIKPSSSCTIKTLTDVGASIWAALVAHGRISACRACGYGIESAASAALPSAALKFFDAQAAKHIHKHIPPPIAPP